MIVKTCTYLIMFVSVKLQITRFVTQVFLELTECLTRQKFEF